jgi:hypothetical protein
MSLDAQVLLGVAISVGLVGAMLVRQQRVYSAYQAVQQQVIERQTEAMVVQRELLEQQKETVRLLTIIASR